MAREAWILVLYPCPRSVRLELDVEVSTGRGRDPSTPGLVWEYDGVRVR